MANRIRIQPKSLQRLSSLYRRAPQVLYGRLESGLRLSGVEWEREMARRTRGQTRPEGLGVRTGDLRRSISTQLTGTAPDIRTLKLRCVSAGVPYAPIHEFGGTITPKRAKNLTIPIAANKTAGGDVRYPSARALFASKSPTRSPFIYRKNGKAFIALNEKGKPLQVLFVLAKSVKIPARLGFMKTWEKYGSSRRTRFRKALASSLRKARA